MTVAFAKSSTAYDQIPYESRPFECTQPGRVGAIATLFDLEVAAPKEARYLEIGCGMGDNILPLAARFPGAQFVGVDLSAVHIERATRLKAAMGLENVSLRRLNVADIDSTLGTFDYIVCHGVYSWVDPRTREAILRVCGERLSAKGIALISYNTLPGWRQVEALREMMQFHVAGIAAPSERIEQAKSLIRFLIEGAPSQNSGYREFLANELKMIDGLPPSYLLHDHLGSENNAFYLHQIATAGHAHNLWYFSDANPEVTYAGAFPERIRETLKSGIDPIQIEQYIDYLSNRRFRYSLFTKGPRAVNRALRATQIFSFHVSSLFPSVSPGIVNLRDYKPHTFESGSGVAVTAQDRHWAAIMLVLSSLDGRTIRANELLADAKALLAHEGNAEEAEKQCRLALLDLGLELVMRGALRISLTPIEVLPLPPEKPRALAPASEFISANRSTFWSDRHEMVRLDTVEAALLSWCDGTNDIEAIADKLAAALDAGTISSSIAKSEDPSVVRAGLMSWAKTRVADFHKAGLFRT